MQSSKLEKLLNNERANSFICYNPQHVLISLLLSYHHDDDNFIYICNRYPAYNSLAHKINNNSEFVQKAFGIDDLGLRKKYKSRNIFKKIWKYFFYKRHLNNIFNKRNYVKPFTKSDIFMFHDGQFLSQYILTHHDNIHLIEEGVGNYATQKGDMLSVLKKIHGIYPPFGHNPRIQNIFVENQDRLPKKLRPKGALFNKDRYFRNIPDELSEELIKIFLNQKLLKDLNSNHSALLITQPFSEDYCISEQKKIEIYSEIVQKISQNKRLYIKPHPREKTDYESIASGKVKVLNRNFPIEIINLFDQISFDIVVTLSSSSIDYLYNNNRTYKLGDIPDDDEKYFTNILKNLQKIDI